MNTLNSVYLSRKERRRFLEIANGDAKASNTPEEYALFRKKLVRESMVVITDPDTLHSTVDMHAVMLSDLGEEYYAQYMNQQKKSKQDAFRFWLSSLIAVASLLLTAFGLLR